MKKWIALVLLGGFMSPLISSAIDLKQSKFTQVVNNVEIISAADQKLRAASVNDIFSMPDLLRTGPDSRAELEATDGTITRVGANTIFAFDPASRSIDLRQGSLLFHSPHGKGGGTIHTGSATASVIGTTIIITCTPNGGFKLLDLEGQAEVRYLDGLTQTLEPGQMTFILPGGSASPVIVFRLDTETKGSALVSGFDTALDSQSKINSEITQQLLQILNGTAADTGYVVGNNATVNSVQVIVDNINNTPPPSGLPAQFKTDGSIIGNPPTSGDTLPVNYSPLDPAHTFDSSITPLTADKIAAIDSFDIFSQGLSFLGLTAPASGFFGGSIDIDTANVDLSSFAGKSDFDIMATGNLKIWQSVDFNAGISPAADSEPQLPDVVSLIAGGQMLIASGSTLEADTTTFGLVADGFGTLDTSTGLPDSDYPNALEDVSFVNHDGAIQILSLSDFTLEDYGSIYAGNDGAGLGLEIESEGDLTLGNSDFSILGGPEWNVLINTGGDVDLVAGHNIGMYDTYVNAAGGDIQITAGGNIDIENSDLEASSPESFLAEPAGGATGSVIINGAGVDVENTRISADGDVGIESGGTLYLGWNSGGDEISAGSSVSLTSDNGDVDVDELEIYADGSDENGNGINISAGGNVDIEDSSEIYAYDGGVSITGNGSVYLYDDDIEAGEDADSLYDLDVTSYGSTVDIDDTYLYADGGINIESGDTLTVEDGSEIEAGYGDASLASDHSDVNIYDSEVYSDLGNVNISAGGNVYLSGGDIESGYDTDTAYEVNIHAYDGTIDIEDGTYIDATGDVKIESSDALYVGWYDGYYDNNEIDANGTVNLTSDNGDVDIDDYEIYAYGSDENGNGINISAGGNADLDDTYLYADDAAVNIESGGTLTLEDSSEIDAYGVNGISLTSDSADVDMDDSSLKAYNGEVNISAVGSVEIEDGSDIYANDDVNITSSLGYSTTAELLSCGRGDVDIDDSTIKAGYNISYDESPASYDGGSVTIDAWNGHVDLSDDDIEAYSGANSDGDVNIRAYNGSVDLDDVHDLYADGTINIEGFNSVTVEDGSDLEGYNGDALESDNSDVNISDSEVYSDYGTVSINAVGAVNISDSDIYGGYYSYSGGTANITGMSVSVLDNSDIYAYDDVNITSQGASPDGDAIDIEDSDIYAGYNYYSEDGDYTSDGGSVNINANNGDAYLYDDDIEAYSGEFNDGDVNIYASGTADIEDTYIEAGGNVSIESGDTLYLGWFDDGDEIYSDGGTVNLKSDNSDVDIDDYEIYAYGSDENGNGINIFAGGNVDIEDSSSIYAYYGGVSISANGGVTLSSDDIYAYDNVNITSSLGSAPAPDAFSPVPGSVDIEYSHIYAGYSYSVDGYSYASYDGGSVNINAYNGDADFYDDEIYARSGANSDGDVNIYANGSMDLDYVYDLSADGSIYIESGDTLTVEDSSDLETYNGGVSLKSDNSDVVVNNSEIYSYGNVVISAADNVYASDAYIEAGYDSDTGDVDINALNGTADLEDTYVSAEGSVYIESSGTLTLNHNEYDGTGSGYHEVYAYGGSVNLTSDNANVDINNYSIYAEEGGDLNISAGEGVYSVEPLCSDSAGNVDMENSYFEVSGSVNVNAAGNVYVDDSYFDMSGDGDINVNAGGNIDVLYTDGSGSGSINLTGGGYVNVYDYSTELSALNVIAGTYASVGADQYVHIHHSSIKANGGGVNITGNSAGVDIDDTSITATGDIDVTAGGGYEESSLSGRRVALSHGVPSFIAPLAAGGQFVVLGAFTPETFVEPAPISAPLDYIDENGASIEDTGTLDLEANIDANIQNNSSLVSDNGNVMVNSGGIEEVDSSYIDANGSVYLTAVGSVSLSDSLASSDIYAQIYAGNGDVDIQSSGSTVDIEDTYIYAHGSVNIESSGTLTLGYTGGNSIAANNGDVSLTSDNADVDAYNYSIQSDYGNVNISAGGNVYLSGDSIYSYNSGDVNIQSLTGTVDLEDTYIYAAGNVGILSYDTLTLGNSSGEEIDASGWVNLSSSTGDVNIDRYSIYTYGSDIDGNGATISAAGTLTLDDYDYVEAYNGSVYLNAGGDVDIDNSDYIYAGDGDLDISAGGSISMNDNSDVEANSGSVNLSAGGTIYLNDNELYSDNADVNITAPGASGTIDIENTYISASGNVNIESSGTLTLGSESASTIDASGTINLTSDTADVDIYTDYEMKALGSDVDGNGVNISAGGNIDIENDGDIYADYGGVKIDAADNVYLENDDIEAGDYSDAGDMNITSSGSTVDVAGTYLYAAGDVNITSSGTLTIEDYYDSSSESYYYSEIDSDGSSGISLTSDNSDVDVYDSSLFAYYGNVNITAVGDSAGIDLEDDNISAYGNVNIESDGTLSLGNIETGGDTIYAGSGIYLLSDNSDVEVYNSTIDGGFDGTVDDAIIEDGSALTSDADVNINAYGATVSIHAPNGSVYINNTTINPGGGINISDSTITAGGDSGAGGVNIYSDGYIYVGGYSDVLSDDNIVGNNIVISGSPITANNGGISIVNDAYISTLDSVGFNVENSTVVEYGDITISASQITANNGGVNIETASSDLSEVYVDEVSSLSVGDISISGSTITATGAGGDVTISAGGYLTTGVLEEGDYVKTGGSLGGVSISASGDISLYGSDGATVNYTTAEAAGKVGLESDYDVYAYESSLTADTLAADIYADYGNVDFEYSTAKATLGDVDIEAGHSDTSGFETLTLVGDTVMAGGTMTLTAQGDVDVDQDVSDTTALTAGGDLDLTSYNGNVDEENSTVMAGGSVTLSAPGSVTLDSGSVTASKNVNVTAGTGITINGVAITASDPVYGVYLTSTAGQTAIQNGSSVAGNLTVNSAGGITITSDGSSGKFTGNTMNLTAGSGNVDGGPSISIQNADLSGFASINIVAHTLDFLNVGFGAGPNNFGSWNGVANINNGVVMGDVNFRNDTYVFNGSTTPINSLSQINYTAGPSSVSGLNVYSKQ